MIVFIRHLKINKISAIFFTFLLVSKYAFSEQIIDQDVDITSGSTLSNSGLTIHESSGGPFTIDNAGTIESTNGNTIRIDVDTTLNNSGLIDADVTTNGQAIQFFQNSGNNSLTNSGTIRIESTGSFSPAIKVQDSNVYSITNTATGIIESSGATTVAEGIRVDGAGSSVNLITNQGNISATGVEGARGISVLGDSAGINQINNSGSITAQGGTGVTNGIVFWGGGTSVVNSGSITGTATDENANGIHSARDLTTLNNSGAISGSRHGVSVEGTLTNIINTGTITGTAGYGVNNGGSITNLTNLQNNLTYNGKLPTNYYVKVNSSSSYGKIYFTSASGSMNIGIADDSTLTEGTYEDALDGVTSSNIAISSGTYVSDDNHYKYSIENNLLNQWDLIVNDLTADVKCSLNSNDPDCQKTDCISTSIQNGLNNLNNGNFALMNTFDCNKFGESGKCISIGIRNIQVNEPKSDIDGIVFVYGHKTSPNNRWGFFINSNISYNTNTNLSLSNKTPLLGLYGVWNENADQSGLQIKIGNSYQSTNANIIRPIVGVSDKAEGETSLEYINLMAEFRNNKKINKKITISPYFAAQYSQKHQNGFTETGVDLPITYNDITDTSLTAITGIKYNYEINSDNSIFGASGFEYDIFHNTSALNPTGVSGLTSIDLTKNYNPTRPIITFGLNHNFSSDQTIEAKFQYQELSFKDMSETNLYINYKYSF